MKVSILTANVNKYEVKRLKEEIEKKNGKIIYSEDVLINFPNINLRDLDLVYIYIGKDISKYLRIFLDYLEENGIEYINKTSKNFGYLNKAEFLYFLSKNGIKIPKTILLFDKRKINEIKKLNFPIIAKNVYTHRGKGVFLIENEKELERFLDKYKIKDFIFQEFIKYDKDIRVIFIGDPIGAMERINNGSFKANISQGGIGKKLELNEDIIEIGYKIKEILNCEIFAYDLLLKDGEYYLIDLHINAFGFEGFEKYVNINVAKKIVDYLYDKRNRN